MSYKKNIASNFIVKIISIILGIVTSILVVRSLGAEGKGYIVYFLLIIGLISNYGHFGIINATTYFQKRSKYKEQDVFNVNITYLLIISIIISIIIVLFKFNNIILCEYNWLMTIGGLVIIISTFIFTCTNFFYIGNERIVEINKYNITFVFINFTLICMLYLLGFLNIFSYFSLMVLISIIKPMWFIVKLGLKIKFKIDINLLKAEFKYGIIIYFSALFGFLFYRCDQFLIKRMLGNSQLGIYSVAVVLAELVLLVPASVTTALTGRLYNIEEKSNKRNSITSLTIKYTFYVCLILSIIGIFMTPLIPMVYGKDFAPARQVTIILFIGVIFASIGKVSYPYFFTEGKPWIHLCITFLVFMFNLIFNLILIPIFGIRGAAISSTIAYFLYGVIYLCCFLKMKVIKIDELLLNKVDFKLGTNIIRGILKR